MALSHYAPKSVPIPSGIELVVCVKRGGMLHHALKWAPVFLTNLFRCIELWVFTTSWSPPISIMGSWSQNQFIHSPIGCLGRLATSEVVGALLAVHRETKGTHLRATALSAVARLARQSTALLPMIVEQLGVVLQATLAANPASSPLPPLPLPPLAPGAPAYPTPSPALRIGMSMLALLVAGLGSFPASSSQRSQLHSCLNILNMTLLTGGPATVVEFAEPETLKGLIALIEPSNSILRAKIVLVMAALVQTPPPTGPHLLLRLAQMGFFPALQKGHAAKHAGGGPGSAPVAAGTEAEKGGETYWNACLKAFATAAAACLPHVVDPLAQEVSRGRPARDAARFKVLLDLFPVVSHVLTCPCLCPMVVTSGLLSSLALCLHRITSDGQSLADPARDDFLMNLLNAFEALSTKAEPVLANAGVVIREVLPAISNLLQAPSSDTRFFGLKMFNDILTLLYDHPDLQDPAHVLVEKLLSCYRQILQDDDPIPLYALKLLSSVVQRNAGFITTIERLGIANQLLLFYTPDHASNNVHNARLIRYLVASPDTDKKVLFAQGICTKLAAVLQAAVAAQSVERCSNKATVAASVEQFFEPLVETAYSLLYTLISCHHQQQQQQQQQQIPPPSALTFDYAHEQLAALLPVTECFASLLDCGDPSVSETTAGCLEMMFQYYGAQPDTAAQLLRGTTKEWLLSIVGSALTPYGQPPPPPPPNSPQPPPQPWNPVVTRRILKSFRCLAMNGQAGASHPLMQFTSNERTLLSQYLEQGIPVWEAVEGSANLGPIARDLLLRLRTGGFLR
ncbi:putative serine/threonine-protein kinase RUNKEL [Paratrimastix pyriformis]|uniref:Serine/threonine-protein kinase RUNKEL n=1 Tax=Paratrimastix pyriformis TaxID=342808 RepID=A0ABQ8UUY5_9EUKA|nr:putative serine/threonine-protein kinase RUNKEL [Paratrimastix pyriformis]